MDNWPTPTPYPLGDTVVPELPALDQGVVIIAEELVQGYNTVDAVPLISTIGYAFVVIVFVFCAWSIQKHIQR